MPEAEFDGILMYVPVLYLYSCIGNVSSLMSFASVSSIAGPMHFVLQVAPFHEPVVLILIGAALVAAATMIRSRFSH